MVVASATAWAQSSADAQFQTYHNVLSSAADGLLSKRPAEQHVERVPDAQIDLAFNNAVTRLRVLRHTVESILVEEGLPVDLTAVALVESGGRTTALSPKGALGLWQLMPQTARRYGLNVSSTTDERRDLVKATRAAARYLRDLYAQFGDWQLALAGYNAGETAVLEAATRANSREFQKLSRFLPNETRAYVPAVMTARPLFTRNNPVSSTMLRHANQAHVLYAQARLDP